MATGRPLRASVMLLSMSTGPLWRYFSLRPTDATSSRVLVLGLTRRMVAPLRFMALVICRTMWSNTSSTARVEPSTLLISWKLWRYILSFEDIMADPFSKADGDKSAFTPQNKTAAVASIHSYHQRAWLCNIFYPRRADDLKIRIFYPGSNRGQARNCHYFFRAWQILRSSLALSPIF